jgi:hypothetical protein
MSSILAIINSVTQIVASTASDPVADIALGCYVARVENEAVATFEGPTGSLRIGVERYQFPEITDEHWDSNWLMITGDAVLDGKSWSFRDPCLTTFEMERLANWLDQVSSGKVEQAFCGFTEPNLDFEQVSDATLRIAFSLEALPPWSRSDGDFGEIGINIPIDDRLGAAASSLRALLARFPIRAHNSS